MLVSSAAFGQNTDNIVLNGDYAVPSQPKQTPGLIYGVWPKPQAQARLALRRPGDRMPPVISVSALTKTYKSGLTALHPIDLTVEKGEIFALLGPNGAGKTTLISIICGTVSMSSGSVLVNGCDIVSNYRAARAAIGLVPQEIALDIFATVHGTMRFSRGLFGRSAAPAYIEQLLRDLSLWDKRDARILELSGGMKRRVMIAKALSHEPEILFLDEPTAGVDVGLRRDMWELVRRLRERGVTIILTTHYIEEAEEMADRVGVIDRGRLVLVEEKLALMQKLGKRRLAITLLRSLPAAPPALAGWKLRLEGGGTRLVYEFNANTSDTGIPRLLRQLDTEGIEYNDIETSRTSLEDIFVNLVEHGA
jgi:ABC-2 type transport system ATP-binding protein